MPVTLQPSSLKYKNQNGEFQSAAALKGEPGVGVPSGGTTGQVLSKASGTDYDTKWTTPSGGDVTDVQVNGVSVVTDGVANVPVANYENYGLVKIANQSDGFWILSDHLKIRRAYSPAAKQGVELYQPIVPECQHYATFYGLAKAAGSDEKNSSLPLGQYTDSAKSAISQMLNSLVTITGTTPTITALPGVRYVCGECATLDITLPASGCVDVVFESGSTATVLTITPPTGVTEVEWADGFDPDNLQANATYCLKVIDGKLGVATAWGVQSGGGGEKPWNHVQFSVSSESERTKQFLISNNGTVSQIYIKGTIMASSYSVESLCVFVGGKYIGKPAGAASTTKTFVLLILNRVLDAWIGRGAFTEWNNEAGYAGVLATNSAIGEKLSDGTGDIVISARWANVDFLEGTSIDVWYR